MHAVAQLLNYSQVAHMQWHTCHATAMEIQVYSWAKYLRAHTGI